MHACPKQSSLIIGSDFGPAHGFDRKESERELSTFASQADTGRPTCMYIDSGSAVRPNGGLPRYGCMLQQAAAPRLTLLPFTVVCPHDHPFKPCTQHGVRQSTSVSDTLRCSTCSSGTNKSAHRNVELVICSKVFRQTCSAASRSGRNCIGMRTLQTGRFSRHVWRSLGSPTNWHFDNSSGNLEALRHSHLTTYAQQMTQSHSLQYFIRINYLPSA